MNSSSSEQIKSNSASNEPQTGGSSQPSGISLSTLTSKSAAMVLMNTLDVLRDGCARPTVPASVIQHLLAVAANPEGMSLFDLAKITGTSTATSYRIVDHLATGSPDGRNKGLYLVETYSDPMNRARKMVILTVKGERLIASTLETLIKNLQRVA